MNYLSCKVYKSHSEITISAVNLGVIYVQTDNSAKVNFLIKVIYSWFTRVAVDWIQSGDVTCQYPLQLGGGKPESSMLHTV